jgi:hypothetical protein
MRFFWFVYTRACMCVFLFVYVWGGLGKPTIEHQFSLYPPPPFFFLSLFSLSLPSITQMRHNAVVQAFKDVGDRITLKVMRIDLEVFEKLLAEASERARTQVAQTLPKKPSTQLTMSALSAFESVNPKEHSVQVLRRLILRLHIHHHHHHHHNHLFLLLLLFCLSVIPACIFFELLLVFFYFSFFLALLNFSLPLSLAIHPSVHRRVCL